MSEETAAIACPNCGSRRGDAFRFCSACGHELPATRPVEPQPPAPLPSSPPVATPASGVEHPAAEPSPASAGETTPVPRPASKSRPKHDLRWMRWAVPMVVAAVLLLGIVTQLRQPPNEISVTVGSDRWVTVDPGGVFGRDREFVVRSDGPLRMRTASGKPILTTGVPLSLGGIGGETLELKAVTGVSAVRLVLR